MKEHWLFYNYITEGQYAPPQLVPAGDVVGPSVISILGRSLITPRELDSQEVDDIIDAFCKSTMRAIAAGFDGVELHGAYGYFLQQFASAYSNHRTDRWKEYFAFPMAVIDAVQKIIEQSAASVFHILFSTYRRYSFFILKNS